jgi:hypothetical protein
MAEVLQRMQLGVEVKDRRFNLRLYPATFVRSEAVKWLENNNMPKVLFVLGVLSHLHIDRIASSHLCVKAEEFLQQCVQEGAVLSVLHAGEHEWLQFVPRVIHSGFVYIGGVRRW